MNCEDFRRQLMIDPFCADEVFREHAANCCACARAREEAHRFERALRTALEAEFASQDGAGRVTGARGSVWRLYPLLILPVLLAALWVGMRSGAGSRAGGDLGDLAIGHVRAEEAYLHAQGLVAPTVLASLFASFGASLVQTIGTVRFADRCVIGDGEGIHLVLPGDRGAVTVLVMPGKPRLRRESFRGRGLRGLLLPAGSGSLAVVGQPGEPLDPVARRLLGAVYWQVERRSGSRD
jgi:hypothetical protein